MSVGCGVIHVNVKQSRGLAATIPKASFQAALKASWILTLRCFIVADIFCFKYNSPFEPKGGQGRTSGRRKKVKSTSVRYFTRVDPEERVWSFLQRLDMSQVSPDAAIYCAGNDIGVADGQSSRHHYNTGIYLQGKRTNGEIFGSHSADDPEMDVALVAGPSTSPKFIKLVYRLSHTSKDMAASILRTFQHVYAQVINSTRQALLGDIDECSPLDRKKIQRWTIMDPTPADTCMHDLILEQCRLRPRETAVCSWDGNLTYEELDDHSLRLARHLMQLGVGAEVFVLSCFEKSTWAIVGRLAILRAGGAYISIFASNPPVYLESVIARTKTRILLTDSNFADRFRGIVPIVVEVSPTWFRTLATATAAAAADSHRAYETVRPDNACLVLFTSGSTGTPKGIVQTHQAYATAIANYARDLQLGPHTRFLHFDDYAFDISNLEFLVPLVLGGCCCVPGPMKTVRDLTDQINALDADILFLTPTVAIKLEPEDVPRLKTLCVGGEPLPKDLVDKWDGSTTKLVNQYGMGEVAVCCALNTNINSVGGAKVGRPSTGAIWVVNSSSPEKLMPIGAVGEFLVEGPHLSRGYLDETATRRTEAGFLKAIPQWMAELHPSSRRSRSTRMYRSGDLGRLNHDGTLNYLGRKDTILKLDGCRIDALEVEHQARKCLSDTDAIVVDLLGIINGEDEPSLTAFLYLDEHPDSSNIPATTTSEQNPRLIDATTDALAREKIGEIQGAVTQSLPQYMVPTTFVLLSWIPRTASKKIDRKKLHTLGQKFYFARLAERPKDVSYAQKI